MNHFFDGKLTDLIDAAFCSSSRACAILALLECQMLTQLEINTWLEQTAETLSDDRWARLSENEHSLLMAPNWSVQLQALKSGANGFNDAARLSAFLMHGHYHGISNTGTASRFAELLYKLALPLQPLMDDLELTEVYLLPDYFASRFGNPKDGMIELHALLQRFVPQSVVSPFRNSGV